VRLRLPVVPPGDLASELEEFRRNLLHDAARELDHIGKGVAGERAHDAPLRPAVEFFKRLG
jgi:hypothetical protein